MCETPNDPIEEARGRWYEAATRASELAQTLFQPGTGYGDPDARLADEHRLHTAREEADRLYREYSDLDRIRIDNELLTLQRSQRFATWASFALAFAVGAATIVHVIVALTQ